MERGDETADRRIGAEGFDRHATRVIPDPSSDADALSELKDPRPVADALHGAADFNVKSARHAIKVRIGRTTGDAGEHTAW